MPNSLSDALHAQLDAMGAAPREEHTAPETELQPDADLSGDAHQADATGEPIETALDESRESAAAGGQDEAGNGEDTSPESLVAFAEAAGWQPQDLYGLTMTLDDGGDGREATTLKLGDIKDRLQKYASDEASFAQQRERLAYEQQEFQNYRQQAAQGQAAMSEQLQAATKRQAEVQAGWDSVDWDKLKTENPGQYAAYRQDFGMAFSQAKTAVDQAQAEQDQAMQAQQQQALQYHGAKLLELVPEWRDDAKRNAEVPEVQRYLLSMGFEPGEVQAMRHGPAYAVSRDAWLWRQHQADVVEAGRKVRKAPGQVLRPGGGVAKGTAANRQADALAKTAINSGRPDDKLAAARAILGSTR